MTTDAGHTTSTDDHLGTTIAARYQIEAVIGRGGMSTVYRATDSLLGRTVALKVFRPELADADDLRRQRDEIQMVAGLNHPTLVTLFDAVAEDSGRISLVLEYVEGQDLREELAAGRVDERMTALIGADIADALSYVHERGIVHRDLKPGNLLVPTRASGSGPHAKLADFGIARLVDSTRVTSAGSFLGTAGYLSPEQASGGVVGPPSDVYSLGLVLLECLTGVRAFEGSAIESVAARLSRDPEIPAELRGEWREIVSRMTQREPADRATARELSLELRRLVTHSESLDATREFEAIRAPDGTEPVATPGTSGTPAATGATEVLTSFAATTAPVSGRGAPPPPATADADDTQLTTPGAATLQPSVTGRHRPPTGEYAEPTRGSRRWVALGSVMLALAVAAGVWAFIALGADPPAELPAVEYPAVEGDLGDHLEQLQRSVER